MLARCTEEGSQVEPVLGRIEDLGQGIYRAGYTAHAAGSYKVEVTALDGKKTSKGAHTVCCKLCHRLLSSALKDCNCCLLFYKCCCRCCWVLFIVLLGMLHADHWGICCSQCCCCYTACIAVVTALAQTVLASAGLLHKVQMQVVFMSYDKQTWYPSGTHLLMSEPKLSAAAVLMAEP